jgi:hypothetical protein
LGDLIPPSSIDRFGLYAIGQYCDELVPDGFGGTEPRYTFNGVIRSREDAAKVLDNVASVFRGMIYWGAGAVMTTADQPGTPAKLVTPANVIDGEFNYSGSPLSSRSSSVAVTWNDPVDLGKSSVIIVQRDDLIRKFGDRRREVTAVGCTSRGQAQRVADWILYTEEYETEMVSYQASLDHADVRPGQIISIADPSYAGARFGGRLRSATSVSNVATFELDGPVTMQTGETYSITVVEPDGSLTSYDLVNEEATVTTVTATTDFAAASNIPIDNAVWIVTASDVQPREFRVVSNTEKAKNIYEITAVIYNNSKYDFVERDIDLDAGDFTVFDDYVVVKPVTGLTASTYLKPQSGGVSSLRFVLGWDTPTGVYSQRYRVWLTEPNEARRLVEVTEATNIEIAAERALEGSYTITVQAVGLNDAVSPVAEIVVDTTGVFALSQAPTGWTGEGTLDGVILTGDASTNPAFKAFRIYGATDADPTLIFLADVSEAVFVRFSGESDNITRYKVSEIDHNSDAESALTDFITVSKLADFTEVEGRVGILEANETLFSTADLNLALQDLTDQAYNAEERTRIQDLLQAAIDGVEATLETEYLVAADVDLALALFRQELTAQLGQRNLINTPYPYTGSSDVFGGWNNLVEDASIPVWAPVGATSFQATNTWAFETLVISGDADGKSFSIELDCETLGAPSGIQVGIFSGSVGSPNLISSVVFPGNANWTAVSDSFGPLSGTTTEYFFGVRAAGAGEDVRFRNLVILDDSEKAGIYSDIETVEVAAASANQAIAQQSLELQSSFKPGDYIITNSPRTGTINPTGQWQNVTVVANRPSSAPSFAESFQVGGTAAYENPRRIANLNGRTLEFTSQIDFTNAPSGVVFEIVGTLSTDLSDPSNSVIESHTLSGSGWTAVTHRFTPSVDTVNWVPRLRCLNGGETADFYNAELFEQTDAETANAAIQQEASTRAAEDASQASLITTLQSDLTDAETDISNLSSDLSVNYYTKTQVYTQAQTNSQISSTIAGYNLDLNSDFANLKDDVQDAESDISSINSNLSINYYTKAETDGEISTGVSQGLATYTVNLGGSNVTLQQLSSAVDGVRGEWSVVVNNNGVVSGIQLLSEQVDGGGSSSQLTIQANKFRVVSNTASSTSGAKTPFEISGSFVRLSGDVLIDGSLTLISDINKGSFDSATESQLDDASADAAQGIADAATAQVAANAAQATADSKPDTYRQSSTPSSPNTGDIWIDTSNNKVKRYNGSSWQTAVLEAESVVAGWVYTGSLSAAQVNAVAINASSISTGTLNASRLALNGSFLEVGTGGVLQIADDAIDTDQLANDAVGSTQLANDVVNDIQTGVTDSAQALTDASNAQSDATQAIGDAATAQATADSKNETFIQFSAPTATGVGDLWFDTSGGFGSYILKRWSGSSWVEATIQAYEVRSDWVYAGTLTASQVNAVAINAGSITAGVLSATVLNLNGTMFTAAGNTLEIADDGIDTAQIANDAIENAQIANNAVQSDQLSANAVTAGKIAANAVTATEINVTNLSAINADLGTITGGSLNIGTSSQGLEVNVLGKENSVYANQNHINNYALYAENHFDNNSFASGAMFIRSHNGYTLQIVQTDNVTNNVAASIQNSGSGGGNAEIGCAGLTGGYAFEAISGGYYDTSGDGYAPFTGKHEAYMRANLEAQVQPGDIVCDRIVVARKGVSDAITIVRPCTKVADKTAVGVYANTRPDTVIPSAMIDRDNMGGKRGNDFTEDDVRKLRKARDKTMLENRRANAKLIYMNSLGEGLVNVCGRNGDFEAGDLVVTSDLPGKGQKQADDVIRNYTVAKVREPVTFSHPDEVKTVACIYLCG